MQGVPVGYVNVTGSKRQALPKVADQDDVAALAASTQRQLPAVTRPVKVENQSRFKIRDLFRRSASQFLLPDVRDADPG